MKIGEARPRRGGFFWRAAVSAAVVAAWAAPAAGQSASPASAPAQDAPAVEAAAPSAAFAPAPPSTVSTEAPSDAEPPARGPITGLPLPRFVSLKAAEANIRRGPGLDRRVDWVFVRRGMPLQVVAEHGHWRRVRDMDGATGWVHYSLIRGNRTAVVVAEIGDLRRAPDDDAGLAARAERGVILDVAACRARWCEVAKGRAGGWMLKDHLWGVGPDERFD